MPANRNDPAGDTGFEDIATPEDPAGWDAASHAAKLPPASSRPVAVGFLILALWISIGMILSAAAVTVTFLA